MSEVGKKPMHTMIVGGQGVGKSTLIRRVLEQLEVSLCGYRTRKEDDLADPELGSPIYLYEVGAPVKQTRENQVGYCKDQKPEVYPEVFDQFASKLQQMKHQDKELILMDELGTMEARGKEFCPAVLGLLDEATPILAAVKDKYHPFLEQVRNHPNCQCFTITRENRDELVEEVAAFVRQQLSISRGE